MVDLTAVAPAARLDAIRRDGEARQRTFALDASPLLQVIAYTTGTDSTAWVLLIAHHLVIDGVSWRILLDDLQRAYVAAAAGRSLDLPPRTTSYRGWIARLEAEAAMLLDALPFWQTPTPRWVSGRHPGVNGRGISIRPWRHAWTPPRPCTRCCPRMPPRCCCALRR